MSNPDNLVVSSFFGVPHIDKVNEESTYCEVDDPFNCPHIVENLMKTRENGEKYFNEGDMAYRAIVMCNEGMIGKVNCPLYVGKEGAQNV